MNAIQIQHVQDSFRLVASIADEAAALFLAACSNWTRNCAGFSRAIPGNRAES